MGSTTSSEHTAARLALTARQAVRAVTAATTLFEAGGRALLDDTTRDEVRARIEAVGQRALGGRVLVGLAPDLLLASPVRLEHTATVAKVGRRAVRIAAREVVRSAGRAAVQGALLDGAVGAAEAAIRYRSGSLDGRGAVRHVAVEAGTGGMAAAAGVGAIAALVAVTGPVGWTTTLAVMGGVSGLTKLALARGVAAG